jgi:hypothetical protein
MIERQSMRDASATIVSDNCKLIESQSLHYLDLILGHRAF